MMFDINPSQLPRLFDILSSGHETHGGGVVRQKPFSAHCITGHSGTALGMRNSISLPVSGAAEFSTTAWW